MKVLKTNDHAWVVDDLKTRRLVGVITEHDLIKGLAPPELNTYSYGKFNRKVFYTARDIDATYLMNENVITCEGRNSVRDVVIKMLDYRVRRIPIVENGKLTSQEVPLRNAMNEVLRDEYVSDCERACTRWNRTVAEAGLDFRFRIPSRRFNRSLGIYSDYDFNLDGELISKGEWEARQDEWLPTDQDRAFVKSLMVPCYEPGQFASWIAAPQKGVKGKPIDYEYVIRANGA